MAKTNEAELRIRAKNLASKDLREVGSELDKLNKKQLESGSDAALAARKVKELRDEYESLRAIEKELGRRADFAKKLQGDKAAVGRTTAEIRKLQGALAALNNQKSSGVPVKGINQEIKKTERAIAAANNKLAEQTKRFQKSAEAAGALGINSTRTAQSIGQINTEAARTAALIQTADSAMQRYNGAVKAAREELKAQQAAQRAITEEVQRRAAIESAASAKRRAEAAALLAETIRVERKRADSIAAYSRPIGRQASATPLGPGNDTGAREASAAKAAAAEAARSAAFRERLINVMRRQADGGEKLIANDGKLAAASRKLTSALQAQGSATDRSHKLGGLLADTGRKSLSVYQRLRGQILATAAAYIGLYQAANLVTAAVTREQERRRIEIQMRVANKGDVGKAAKDIDFLRAQADRLGLVYEDVAKNYANFKIAAQSVGASNNTTNKSFVAATEIVTGLALSADDADGVFRAFVQILGKARVQAEELRGQLGDRLPGAVAKFAEANNIALSDLDAYLKKGKGSVQNFLKFLNDYAKTVQVGVKENSNTLFAQFNRLKNSYGDFLVTFAKSGVSSGLADIVNKLIAKLDGSDGGKFAKDLAYWFTWAGKVLLFFIDHFDTLVTALKYYLALQFTKAILSLGASFVIGGAKVLKAAGSIMAYAKAANVARAAGAAMTLGQRSFLALMGPLGIGLTGLAALYYALGINARNADAEVEALIDSTKRLAGLKGVEGVKGIKQAAGQIRDLAREERDLMDTQKRMEKAGPDPFGKLIDAAAGTKLSLGGVKTRLVQVRAEIQLLKNSAVAAGKRLVNEAKASAKEAHAAAAEQDHFVAASPDDSKDKSKADAEAAAAEALAERRRDIADRAARELLDIEKALSEARLAAEVTTQAQIDANLKESLSIIGNEIDKKRSELEGLKHDAERAGSADGAASAQAAINRLPALQAEQNQRKQIEATTASIELKEKNINDLIAARDGEIARINALVEVGLMGEATARQKIVDLQLKSKDAIQGAIDALITQLEALKASDPNLAKILGVDELIQKLGLAKIKAGEVVTVTEMIGKKLGGEFASGVASAFSTFIKGATGGIEGVKGIGDAFQNAGSAFMDFLANFLVGIGEAILQAIILKAIMNAITGGSGGYGDAAIGALTGHTGGVVGSTIGSGNEIRKVSTAMFAGAQRFHDGGLPGLKSNEVPAILKKREEVLTENDPRNVLNGGLDPARGAQAQPSMDVSIINTIDSASVVEAGANSDRGRKAIYNVIRANRNEIKRMLG